ncbi:BrnT family toxin [Methylobacterium sp. E-065]|uniref:BrnT family toxin n=1 Tax=Methylobacterium sp. E-065 TaxID=2836583 RepID=UPI001FBA931B|nr:BrnT family toxin [Methylobacterium sp. E-065]MCJ2016306.1 BrnT family toxin [Methylobacterium sp. E-065]
MAIIFDPAKRDRTLAERGLDFAAAEEVFAGRIFTFDDEREDYDETRRITFGFLNSRMVVVGWTPRGADRHVFSMRKANDREQRKYAPLVR